MTDLVAPAEQDSLVCVGFNCFKKGLSTWSANSVHLGCAGITPAEAPGAPDYMCGECTKLPPPIDLTIVKDENE